MKFDFLEHLKKPLLDAEDGNAGGGAGAGEGASEVQDSMQELEVPEYISSYAEGLEDEGQREYVSGLLKDEKGLNLLKKMIRDPAAQYSMKAEEFEVINRDEVENYLTEAHKMGIPEEYARVALEGRANYLKTEREKMTPDMLALEDNISNFIAGATSPEEQQVYARLAENAVGRKILIEKIMGGGGTRTVGAVGSGAPGGYTESSFIERYNDAYDSGDKKVLTELRNYAEAKKGENPFFADFLGLK